MDKPVDISKQNQAKIDQVKEMFKENKEVKKLEDLKTSSAQTEKLKNKAKTAIALSIIGLLPIIYYIAMLIYCITPCYGSGCAICGWVSLLFWYGLFPVVVLLFSISLIMALKVRKEFSKESVSSDITEVKKYCNTTLIILYFSITSLIILFCIYCVKYGVI